MAETTRFTIRPGRPLPLGATPVGNGVNFSVFSKHATGCTLVLFEGEGDDPVTEIPFPESFRAGNVWSMLVNGLDPSTLSYGYRFDGPHDPVAGHRFDPAHLLIDPYSEVISGREIWGSAHPDATNNPYRGRVAWDDFEWNGDRPLPSPLEELVIYELHVRGFTRHPSSGVRAPGTFAGIVDKIPYLVELGVNCVELMPVFEFDEMENSRMGPDGHQLVNYWGYSTVGAFAPKAGYSAEAASGRQSAEMKELVKQMHRAGIEVFLDLAFSHTAEGNDSGPYISFKGIDNKVYYMLTPDGRYFNFSGTGNTLNSDNPIVRSMVLDCLRHWAAEYHVDGFRFDLASLLGRDPWGAPQPNPSLLEALASDPVLAGRKLITDSWGAGGLDQAATVASPAEWAEWNESYQSIVRRFLKGDAGLTGEVARRISGSADLFRRPSASINMVTSHQGFTLADLVSYDRKHNELNGENNTDGQDDNFSWNCGIEGPTDDPEVLHLRTRQSKNAIAILMVSQGVPMLLMGDEIGRSQRGNNNAYCHDSDLTWLDWDLRRRHGELFDFFRKCIKFRRAHPELRKPYFPLGEAQEGRAPEISWHGTQAWAPDWSPYSRTLAFMLSGSGKGSAGGEDVYVAMNMHWEGHDFRLPALPEGRAWHVFANTGATAPQDASEPGSEPRIADQERVTLGPRSVMILVGS